MNDDQNKAPSATTSPQRDGDVGGIPQTADSALRNDKASTATPAATRRDQSPGGGDAARDKATDKDGKADAAKRADEKTPEDESALESLGRAIGAPLSGEASDEEPRR
ncbi:hypothetical protein [Piscinibacter sakaiensis]|uniref:hypothetical protein n=1 Tax=Piscinibacter sakaiensis TaxID=1547922 RepID=UPI003AAF3264